MPSSQIEAVIARAAESADLLPTLAEATVIGSHTMEHFLKVGHDFLGYLVDMAGMEPDNHVLEIGSGIGRIFIPMTRYLSPAGSFDGIEPIERFVKLSNERVSPKFPNFKFHFVDFANDFYNPSGKVDPANYRFPWPDASFDIIYLVSVLLHVRTPVVDNYLKEIARLLKPGGKMVTTAFLLNKDIKRRMSTFTHGLVFPHRVDDFYAVDPSKPEGALAFDEKQFLKMLNKRKFTQIELHRGDWMNPSPPSYGSFLDLIIARRPLDR